MLEDIPVLTDNCVRVLKVVPPQRTNLCLPSNIPHSKVDILVIYGFDIETFRIRYLPRYSKTKEDERDAS